MAGHHHQFAAEQGAFHRAPPKLQSPAGRVLSSPRPAASSSSIATAPRKLTPWAKRQIKRRQRILAEFAALLQGGSSKRAAARQLRVDYGCIYRWQRRIIPLNGHAPNSGRPSALSQFTVPETVIDQVERLQLNGRSNDEAWRAVASYRYCPPPLAEFLRSTRNIPQSFLHATRLKREMASVIKGKNFTVVQT